MTVPSVDMPVTPLTVVQPVGVRGGQACSGQVSPPRYTPPATRSYWAGTYVGSVVALSMIDPYAATRPLPLVTWTMTRAL